MAAVAAAYGKKASPTDHNKASFDILRAYGLKSKPSPPRRKSRRRRRSASNENIYRWSPKSAMQSPRSKSVPRSRKRSSSRKRLYSPSGALGVIRQPQILQAIMAGLNAETNRPGLAGLFPNEARHTVGKYINTFPMKTRYKFAVGNRDIMNPSKKYGDYRPVTTADIDNDEFRKHLVQSARYGPWGLLEPPVICIGGLWIKDGLLMVDNSLIMPAAYKQLNPKRELFAPYSPINYTTKVPWADRAPSLERSKWNVTLVSSFNRTEQCLYVKEA